MKIDTFGSIDLASRSFEIYCTLNSAISFDIFELIETNQELPNEYRKILNLLEYYGLIFKKKNKYLNSKSTQKHLLKNSPYPLLKYIEWKKIYSVPMWEELSKGKLIDNANHSYLSKAQYELFHQAMDEKGKYYSDQVINLLKNDKNIKKSKSFLDLGCGSGIHGLNFLSNFSGIEKAYFNDLDLNYCKQKLKSFDHKVEFIEKSFLEEDFPSVDFSIIGYVFCDQPKNIIKKILEKCKKSGITELIIIDYVKNQENSLRFDLLIQVELGNDTNLMTVDEFKSLLKAAGYKLFYCKELDNDHFLLRARLC